MMYSRVVEEVVDCNVIETKAELNEFVMLTVNVVETLKED